MVRTVFLALFLVVCPLCGRAQNTQGGTPPAAPVASTPNAAATLAPSTHATGASNATATPGPSAVTPGVGEAANPAASDKSHSILSDPGFDGAILGGIVGAILAGIGAIISARQGAFITIQAVRVDSKQGLVLELLKEFVYGSMLKSRLNAELLLHYDTRGRFNKTIIAAENNATRQQNTAAQQIEKLNFEDLYKGAMSIEEYADVAAVLNLFRLLDDYKNANRINADEAKKAFGWIYKWWWDNIVEPRRHGLENNADWAPHITKRDWLYP
jgi:hypothetical protein